MHLRNTLLRGLAVLVPLALAAQNLQEFEKKVTEFTLPNGLHFIVLERHNAPTASFFLMVNTGSADDPKGATGLAHMFEHMAFKGNDTLGTKDFPAEKKTLAEVEAVYDRLENERRKGPRADKVTVAKLEKELHAAIEKANSYADGEAYSRVIQKNGGVGLNAGTSTDFTIYFYSLPANRKELWFLLTSKMLDGPVYREFYKERDVVREERRMRIESSPQGKAQELLMSAAFLAHPYKTIGGWASDIENLRAKDAEAFFRTYYVPANMVVAIAGDVDPKEIRRLADAYFGGLKPGPMPPPVITREPKQEGERRLSVATQSQPFVLIGYRRPEQTHPDAPALDVLSNILSSGRTGLIYREMVRDKKLALGAGAVPVMPGGKYPNLFLLYSFPNAGKTIEENEKALYEILERAKKEKPDETTLKRVKTKVRAGLIRQLDSSYGLGFQLATYYTLYGDWRKLFTRIDDIEKVTADDVVRVAKEYLGEKSRTVVINKTEKGEGK